MYRNLFNRVSQSSSRLMRKNFIPLGAQVDHTSYVCKNLLIASCHSTSSRTFSTKEDLPEINANRIAFIGGGNMAEAIINGIVANKLVNLNKLVVSDPNPACRDKFKKLNIPVADQNRSVVKDSDVIILAVKPQLLDTVLSDIKQHINPKALVISILAGAKMNAVQEYLGEDACLVRSMPNTPAMIGEGVTVWSQSQAVNEEQHIMTKSILGALGEEVFVEDESNLDMATALSGSGPAYFFLVAEAMIDAAVHMGFPRNIATKLVQQTMTGSALYMSSSEEHPVLLRNNITSPGGTTAAALYRAEKNGFRAVIADSIWAAYERCLELGSAEPIKRQRPRS